MSIKNGLTLCAVTAAVVFSGVTASWSQESSTEPQWLWGEVEAVNTQAKTVQVKYLDYDTDIEKELVITVDEKTKFENAKGLEEVKAQDTVSVDYLVGGDGKNLALAVSVEKLEDMDVVPADVQEPAVERVGSAPVDSAVVQSAPAVPTDASQKAPAEVKQ